MARKPRIKFRTSTDALFEVLEDLHSALVKEIFSNRNNRILLALQPSDVETVDLIAQNILTKIIQIRFLEDLQFIQGQPLIQLFVKWDEKKPQSKSSKKLLFPLIKKYLEPLGLWKTSDETLIKIHLGDFVLLDVLEELTRIVCNEFFLESIIEIAETYLSFSSTITAGKLIFSLNRNDQQKTGAFHTPPKLVNWITKRNVSNIINQQIKNRLTQNNQVNLDELDLSILDPACGAGVFLYYTQKHLHHQLHFHLEKKHLQLKINKNGISLSRLIFNQLYGVDLNPRATNFTHFLISTQYILFEYQHEKRVTSKIPLNIICTNFLKIPLDAEIGYHSWKTIAPTCFNKPIHLRGFTLVIGNPPFLMEVRQNKDLFRELKQIPYLSPLYEQKMDIAYFFVERAIQLLSKGKTNSLVMLLPTYWISRSHAARFREYLANETQIDSLVNFGHLKLFKSAKGHHTSILSLTRKQSKSPYTSERITFPRNQTDIVNVIESLQKQDGLRYRVEPVTINFNPKDCTTSIFSPQEQTVHNSIQNNINPHLQDLLFTQGLIAPNE
ncbi:MAG: Eco57I restriction-modification methylase domain-containing protein, partial [Candidatus Ranarchaeia archaeon]